MRYALLILLLAAVACTTTVHDKRTVFESGSIQNYPAFGTTPMKAEPILDEDGNVLGFAAGTSAGGESGSGGGGDAADPAASPAPRTSGATGSGDVMAEAGTGNIIISIGQNDGVEQKGGTAKAAAQVNSPSSDLDADTEEDTE